MKLSLEEEAQDEQLVHDHGLDPTCKETEIGDRLIGECLRHTLDRKLNINQLASHCGKKRYWVAEKLQGIEPAELGKKGAKFYWLSDVEELLAGGEVQGKATEKAEGQARKVNAEADLKELEVKKRTGEVVEVSDVEQGGVELFRALHNRLTNYCSQSALEISKLTTRGEVEKYQKESIGTILQALRDDPNNFITRYLDAQTS